MTALAPSSPSRTSDRENVVYLRYRLQIVGERGRVTVFAPDGRRIARVASVSSARRLVRSDRRAA